MKTTEFFKNIIMSITLFHIMHTVIQLEVNIIIHYIEFMHICTYILFKILHNCY